MLLDCDTGPGRAGCSESTQRRVMRKQRHGGGDIHGQGETGTGAQQMTGAPVSILSTPGQ